MAERGRPKAPLVLSEEERQTLERWARRRTSAQGLALRARIVLTCAQGATNVAVAEQLGIWPQTVAKWRGRFVRERLEALSDEPRPGRPRTIGDDQVKQVIVATLERPPPDHDTHWSTRSMARATGMSQTAISRIWRAFGLKPHLEQTWKLSADPQFIDKVRDILVRDPVPAGGDLDPSRALAVGEGVEPQPGRHAFIEAREQGDLRRPGPHGRRQVPPGGAGEAVQEQRQPEVRPGRGLTGRPAGARLSDRRRGHRHGSARLALQLLGDHGTADRQLEAGRCDGVHVPRSCSWRRRLPCPERDR
jgi:transposase